jgi:hypothetical protein
MIRHGGGRNPHLPDVANEGLWSVSILPWGLDSGLVKVPCGMSGIVQSVLGGLYFPAKHHLGVFFIQLSPVFQSCTVY